MRFIPKHGFLRKTYHAVSGCAKMLQPPYLAGVEWNWWKFVELVRLVELVELVELAELVELVELV